MSIPFEHYLVVSPFEEVGQPARSANDHAAYLQDDTRLENKSIRLEFGVKPREETKLALIKETLIVTSR